MNGNFKKIGCISHVLRGRNLPNNIRKMNATVYYE